MKKKILRLLIISLFTVSLLEAQSSSSFFTGISYTNTTLYGDTSWDILDQTNSLSGIIFSYPLEDKPEYNSRIRVAYDMPLWSRIRQLDGETSILHNPNDISRYGVNLLTALEIPVETRNDFFQSSFIIGTTMDFQSFAGAMLMTAGVESGLEMSFNLNEHFYSGLGLSIYYNYMGMHTVGDSSKYELFIKRGWGILFYPYISYRY